MSVKPLVKLSAEELRELQNPREECSFTKYYPDLNEEDLLPTAFIDDISHSNLINYSPNLSCYKIKLKNVDAERLKNLKLPSFRPLKKSKLNHYLKSPSNVENTLKYKQLGFLNIENEKLNLNSEPYLRPNLKLDSLVRGKTLFSSNDFQVAYNMDEIDLLFLNHINSIYKSKQISMELFEIIITFFELELYKLARILPPTIKDRTTIDIQQYQRAILYGSDDGTGCSSESEQECAVCGDASSDISNSIVFCDGCDIAVHQECYGVSFIPEGPWLCRKCLILRNTKAKCLFCPSTTGAFKQTDGGDWAHVICTIWINELNFANPIYMEPIEGVNHIPKSRWRLTCYICKKKMGACVQCSKSSCFQAFHATCGKRSGLYMKMRRGLNGALKNQNSLVTYCDKHSSIEWNKTHDIKTGIQKTKLYFHDIENGIIKDSDSDLVPVTNNEYQELIDTQSNKFQWRLSPFVFVIPEIILDKLISFLKENQFDQIERKKLNQVAKYYTMKANDLGQQLIKKPDVFNLATLSADDLKKRDLILNKFNIETNSLLEIANQVSQREDENIEEIKTQLNASFKFFQPYQYILYDMISPFIKHVDEDQHYPKYVIKPTINEIIQNVKDGEYTEIDSLLNDIEKFQNWVLKTGKSEFKELKDFFPIWNRLKPRKVKKASELLKNLNNWKINSINKGIEFDENLQMLNDTKSKKSINNEKKPTFVTSGSDTNKNNVMNGNAKVSVQMDSQDQADAFVDADLSIEDNLTVHRKLRRRVKRVPKQSGRIRILRSGKEK